MKNFLTLIFLLASVRSFSQDIYALKSGKINFFAGTPVEDIDATNTKAVSFLNLKTGDVRISIPNKEFHFRRALMEEHFNENYMESMKYPKSEFKGKISGIEKLELTSGKPVPVTVTGILTIHGIAKERTFEATLEVKDNTVEANTKFIVPLIDHNIDRPKILWEKIAENVNVTVNFVYELYKK
jgi:hypothetical protein